MDSSEARAKLDELLKAFGTATGVPNLATEDNGACILVFDQRTRINLLVDHTTENLVVWSTLGALPGDKPETVLRRLMKANLFWIGTQGATLGLMPESDDVVLAIRRPVAGVDGQGLADLVELMVERAETLAATVAGDEPPAEGKLPGSTLASAIRG
jgi:hypothetical protein